MSKKLTLSALALGMVLLSGCGGGGGKKESITEQISQRDGVMIIHGANKAFCETMVAFIEKSNDPEVQQVKDVIIATPPNTVNCATYNKNNDGFSCEEDTLANMLDIANEEDIEIYEDPNTACVIGMNKK